MTLAILLSSHVVILIGGGFLVGIMGVVFGGGMFFSVPLMQWIFPSVTFGQIVGNLKVGSFFRSIGSTWTTRRQIEYRRSLQIAALALVGTVIGSFMISHVSEA